MSPFTLDNKSIEVIPYALLAQYTTFQLGGPCLRLINCVSPHQLEEAVTKLIDSKEEFVLIGGGSNLLVSDEGVPINVIRYVSPTPLIVQQGNELIVSGSTILDQLVQFALHNSLQGINYCSGIPGTVGGAIVGNAGAFGKQIGDVLKEVGVLTREGNKKILLPAELKFAYRHSHLKETKDIVLWTKLELGPGSKEELEKEREGILKVRHEKHPDLKVYPCAGSFFRNIEPTSKADRRQAAGYFLEQAGVKEFKVGGAAIFPKHANIIVKSRNCTSQDVHDLSLDMMTAVKQKFNLDLVREVRFVGNFKGKPNNADVLW